MFLGGPNISENMDRGPNTMGVEIFRCCSEPWIRHTENTLSEIVLQARCIFITHAKARKIISEVLVSAY